jgi:hypothetical protein
MFAARNKCRLEKRIKIKPCKSLCQKKHLHETKPVAI